MLKANFYIAVKSLNLPVVVGSAVDPCGVVVSGSGVVGFSLVPPFVDPSGSVVVSITSVIICVFAD